MNTTLWQRKLMAFLHDPPCKCFDIPGHGERARSFRQSAGITDEAYADFAHECDWLAASADRFPFPKPVYLKSGFTGGSAAPFRHPLGGDDLVLEQIMQTATAAEDGFERAIGSVPRDLDDWKLKFWLYWRRWPEQSALHDKRLAYLPADTRLPDHTIWTHMCLTSALQSCVVGSTLQPAFLLFQLGGVQEFIAQAQSTRDGWSGSYLLAWLMAHAMKAVADEVGPDVFIYPNMRHQPVFDALYRREVYSKIHLNGSDTLWDRMYPGGMPSHHRLLMPSLPNRFLALVPAEQGTSLAQKAQKALLTELQTIGESCWAWLMEQGAKIEWKQRWDKQLELFPQVTWQVHAWGQRGQALMNQYSSISFKDEETKVHPAENLQYFRDLAVNQLKEFRDGRCFDGGEPKAGFFWPAQYALEDFKLASRRNTRNFEAFETDPNQVGARKDAWSGKDEILGDEDFWKKPGEPFKETPPLGAMNLIKRLWCRTETNCLTERLGISDAELKRALRFDSVPDVAKENMDPANPYMAILALDGDEMGKWVSGVKTPAFFKQLSDEGRVFFSKHMAEEKDQKRPRPLSPSYHLQFSEALANFTSLVEPIVRHFKGQLIYAGGDDVLAIVPASRALDCAYLLRCAFRGEEPSALSQKSKAFVERWMVLRQDFEFMPQKGWILRKYQEGGKEKSCPLLMPGPKADLSCGMAVGHVHYPLQSLIQEARNAEKRAKVDLERGAFAVSLLKRGGEILHWGAKWDCPALSLYHHFCDLSGMADEEGREHLSNRFAYALAGFLRPYDLGGGSFDPGFLPAEIIRREFDFVVSRQGLQLTDEQKNALKTSAQLYLDHLQGQKRSGAWDEFEKLFLTAVFIHRNRGEE
ncbi:MAG: type III-B CRISPR-associated protein Cas10/Cmr2 [Lentisphaerota bacterium]